MSRRDQIVEIIRWRHYDEMPGALADRILALIFPERPGDGGAGGAGACSEGLG